MQTVEIDAIPLGRLADLLAPDRAAQVAEYADRARASLAGRTVWVPNEHEPWILHPARVTSLRDDLCAAAGLPGVVERPPDSVLFSPGVDAKFGRGHMLSR